MVISLKECVLILVTRLRLIEARIAARNKAKKKQDTGNDSDSGEYETENFQSSWINQPASHMLLFT